MEKQKAEKSREEQRKAEKRRSKEKTERQKNKKQESTKSGSQKSPKPSAENKIYIIPRNLMHFIGSDKVDPRGQKNKAGGSKKHGRKSKKTR